MSNQQLQEAASSGLIPAKIAQALEKLTPGSYCLHRSWGFGQITSWLLENNQILIDFESKKNHPMQLDYAAESLTPLPADDIRVRVRTQRDQVASQAASSPADLVNSILDNFGGSATQDQILGCLIPHIFSQAEAKKWWESAKKKLKTDGRFSIPAKKGLPIQRLHSKQAVQDSLLSKLRSAKNSNQLLLSAEELLKFIADHPSTQNILPEIIQTLEAAAESSRRNSPAKALEILLISTQIRQDHPQAELPPQKITPADILREHTNTLARLVTSLPAARQKHAIAHLRDAFGDSWTNHAISLLRQANARLAGLLAAEFHNAKQTPVLIATLQKWISERSASSEILYWLAKERGAGHPKDLFTPDLFSAILAALELDALSETKKGTRLRELLLNDKDLLNDLFSTPSDTSASSPKTPETSSPQPPQTTPPNPSPKASPEELRYAMRRLLLTTVFDDQNKRSLIGRLIKISPDLASMVKTTSEQAAETLTVSWPSLEKRKRELDDLVNRLIPQNIKDISIARSYGDLRENFEFKSAKEQKAVLERRRAELERDLARARGTNFENPDTSVVSIGTTVRLTNTATGQTEQYSILGAWDSAPELGIISYKAAIGQALLGRAQGETLHLSPDRSYRIESIEPFTNLDLLVQIHQAPHQPQPPPATTNP